MATVRTHIVLPVELAEEIDHLVGPRGRSAFLVETASREVKRRKLMAFLTGDQPAWSDANHPEIAEAGSADWVRGLRNESELRTLRSAE